MTRNTLAFACCAIAALASHAPGQDLHIGLQVTAQSPGQEMDLRVSINNQSSFGAAQARLEVSNNSYPNSLYFAKWDWLSVCSFLLLLGVFFLYSVLYKIDRAPVKNTIFLCYLLRRSVDLSWKHP